MCAHIRTYIEAKEPFVLALSSRIGEGPTVYLTLGAHAPEGYSTWSVCLSVCVCVCVCFSLFWHLAQSGVQTAVSATSARYGHEI